LHYVCLRKSSPRILQYHDTSFGSSGGGALLVWTSALSLDVPNGTLHENTKGLCADKGKT
jgi:hypothetical protein